MARRCSSRCLSCQLIVLKSALPHSNLLLPAFQRLLSPFMLALPRICPLSALERTKNSLLLFGDEGTAGGELLLRLTELALKQFLLLLALA